MTKALNDLVALALALTPSGEIGDGMVARFHELAKRVQNENHDAALAIGEHAFRAGFEAGMQSAHAESYERETTTVDEAWANYDPPEDIKVLS